MANKAQDTTQTEARIFFGRSAARLKACPDTNPEFFRSLKPFPSEVVARQRPSAAVPT